jgi:membrane protease subunit HflK
VFLRTQVETAMSTFLRWQLITRQEATALVSCAVNLVLTVAKFVLFYTLVKSVSLKAEAWHSLSDIGSSFVVFLALYLGRGQVIRRRVRSAASEGPASDAGERSAGLFSDSEEAEPEELSSPFSGPDEDDAVKPSGLFSEPEPEAAEEASVAPDDAGPVKVVEVIEHADRPRRGTRAEDIVAVGIAVLFVFVSIGIAVEIVKPAPSLTNDYTLVVAAAMLAMAYASYLLYRFEYHVGLASDSPGLIADGYHSKIDMYGSLMVAAALVAQWAGLGFADRVIAALICLVILAHALEVLAMTARHYLGRPVHDHKHGAINDVYALTGKWGERASQWLTGFFATILRIPKTSPDLGRRVTRRVVAILVLGVLLLYGLSGLFVCGPGERAFVERFGRPTTTEPLGPGLHYRIPWPVGRVVRQNVDAVHTYYLGTPTPEVDLRDIQGLTATEIELKRKPILWTNRHYENEFRFLTPHDNFITLFLAVHFRISDLYKFLYEMESPIAVLDFTCQEKVREVTGRREFFRIILDREEVETEIREHLAEKMRGVGIEVLMVAIRDVHPPVEVAPAFEDVISATEQKEAEIYKAQGMAAQADPQARALAAGILADAAQYKAETIANAKASIQAFAALQAQYALAPNVTTARLYLETLAATIASTPKWIVLGEARCIPIETWFPKGSSYWRWTVAPEPQGGRPK